MAVKTFEEISRSSSVLMRKSSLTTHSKDPESEGRMASPR